MRRRDFLRNSALACAMAIASPVLGRFSGQGGSVSAGSKTLDLEEATFGQLQQAMGSGEMTARWITETYLQRIELIDKRGSSVNSVIEINPDALEIADALDRERKEKGSRGPLHGIPVLIKDNIDTADRMMTTAGSLALVGSVRALDSYVAQKLREAGAVILGKTNLSEWANF